MLLQGGFRDNASAKLARTMSFADFFKAATEHAPYDYQSRLACGGDARSDKPGTLTGAVNVVRALTTFRPAWAKLPRRFSPGSRTVVIRPSTINPQVPLSGHVVL